MFSAQDQQQIHEHRLSVQQLEQQLHRFAQGFPFARLVRACTPGDGITQLDSNRETELLDLFESQARQRNLMKFVPASGAATRMFRLLINARDQLASLDPGTPAGDFPPSDALQALTQLLKDADQLALLHAACLPAAQPWTVARAGDLVDWLDQLLGQKGCHYAQTPKALIPFHQYPDGDRTALEEHIVEALDYARGRHGRARLHLTISPEHQPRFIALIKALQKKYADTVSSLEITLSFQKPETDTIAATVDNQVFRDADSKLVFRPGGHGSLIANLNDLDADIVFLKNIDNVVADIHKAPTLRYKKLLAGLLLEIEQQVHDLLRRMDAGEQSAELTDEIDKLCAAYFGIEVKSAARTPDDRYALLHRPLRICGMVKNEGEPGGGPFWVALQDGTVRAQIVEQAQIDSDAADQQKILQASSHFNPVDIVCALRDHKGAAYALRDYIDHEAGFISEKSFEGQVLQALEWPGLWNGAMAYWNTVFVEVPVETFNPVKTVLDLLRPGHQSAECIK